MAFAASDGACAGGTIATSGTGDAGSSVGSGTFFPRAYTLWRPFVLYHSAVVADRKISSTTFRQPTPVLYAQKLDLALLRAVRDDAHLGAAEVVVEEVLEPHAGRRRARATRTRSLLRLRCRAPAAARLAHELPDERGQRRSPGGAFCGREVAQDGERDVDRRDGLRARAVGDRLDVLQQLADVESEAPGTAPLRVLLFTSSTVPMPQFGWQPHLSAPHSARPAGEGPSGRRTAPSADSGNQSRIGFGRRRAGRAGRAPGARACSAASSRSSSLDVLVAPGEAHRLERDDRDLVGVLDREVARSRRPGRC